MTYIEDDMYNNKRSLLIWVKVKEDLLSKYGYKLFDSWFSKLHFLQNDLGCIKLATKTKFLHDWISNNYFDLISSLWKSHDSTAKNFELHIVKDLPDEETHTINYKNKLRENKKEIASNTLDKRFTFENFVVGPPNELAYSASIAIADAKSAIPSSNPLFLYSSVGLGKTHLMQSVAWHLLSNNKNRKFLYISAEKFMNKFVHAIRNKSLLEFKESMRSIDLLMIDDIQFICGKDSTQEEFFHTFNALIDQHKQIIISCDRSPTDLDNIEERIKSRLGWGLVADLHSTTYELRLGILQSKIEQMNVNIPQNILEFMADKVTSNVRELEGALNKIIAYSNLMNHIPDINLTKQLLKDLIKVNEKVISIDEIKKIIARHYGIKVADMSSSARTRNISQPRQLAMYFAKVVTPKKSLSEIGKHFGHKDHTTVMHAIKKVESLCESDVEFTNEIKILENLIKKNSN